MMLFALLWVLGAPPNDQRAEPSAALDPLTVITNPSWRTPPEPTVQDYPMFAQTFSVSGSATVECATTAIGAVKACKVIAEAPIGFGFGEAAIGVVKAGRLSPRRVNGVATDSTIVVTVPFDADPLRRITPKAWRGAEPSEAHMATAQAFVTLVGAPIPDLDLVLGGLSPDRRDVVRLWLVELYPDQKRTEHLFVKAIARSVPQTVLARWLEGQVSAKDSFDFLPAMNDLFDTNAADLELRRRVCARYDCGPAPDGGWTP